ncbi:MAG: hypothetical protein ABI083_08470 [Lapillicoccus sp.]
MRQCRIYLPLDSAGVRVLQESREVGSRQAYAVTQWLERAYPAEDEEGLEYLALGEAKQAALAQGRTHRLVIAAADVESELVDARQPPPGASLAQVALRGVVPLPRVVSFHLEEAPVGSSDDPDLLWYDVTEIDEVLRQIDTPKHA